jgi:hypothetical protein
MPSINGHGSSEATKQIALYLRVSSEEQRDRETIELQREFLEQCRSLFTTFAPLFGQSLSQKPPHTAHRA